MGVKDWIYELHYYYWEESSTCASKNNRTHYPWKSHIHVYLALDVSNIYQRLFLRHNYLTPLDEVIINNFGEYIDVANSFRLLTAWIPGEMVPGFGVPLPKKRDQSEVHEY